MNHYNHDHRILTQRQRTRMMQAVAQRIRKMRLQKRMTQEQVAELAGINAKYLGEIERGTKSPTAVVIQKIAAALDVPACSFLTNVGQSCPGSAGAHAIDKLLQGRGRRDVRKAVKILETLFDEEDWIK